MNNLEDLRDGCKNDGVDNSDESNSYDDEDILIGCSSNRINASSN